MRASHYSIHLTQLSRPELQKIDQRIEIRSVRRPLLGAALKMQADRRRRLQHFNDDLFGEVAWDVLLILYIAEFAYEKITITELTQRAGAPMTTVLRWLDRLSERELVKRTPHMNDGRIIHIGLTKMARSSLDKYFEASDAY